MTHDRRSQSLISSAIISTATSHPSPPPLGRREQIASVIIRARHCEADEIKPEPFRCRPALSNSIFPDLSAGPGSSNETSLRSASTTSTKPIAKP